MYVYSKTEWKKYKFVIFKVTKSLVASKFKANSQLKRPRKKNTIKKKHYKPFMVKKTINPGTRGRKNKVLKGPIDLTGINKVLTVGECPLGKSPTSNLPSCQINHFKIKILI